MSKRNDPGRVRLALALRTVLAAALLLAPAALAAPSHATVPDALPWASGSSGGTDETVGPGKENSSSDLDALRAQLERLLGSGIGLVGDRAVMAMSLDRGDTLFAVNADLPLAPASNQKLLTSAAALHHMGGDFRFQTFLLTDGAVRDGTLDGDLVLYGTGDPSLSEEGRRDPFRALARSLRDRGIHTVRGDIVGDGSFFRGPGRHASWNPRDLNEWFAAPVSALSFNENMVTLQISPGAPGQRPRIRTQPEAAALSLVNDGMTVGGRPRRTLMLVRDDPDEPIELRGEMGPGQADVWRRMTVSKPERFAASILHRILEEEGIRVEGRSRGVEAAGASLVTDHALVAPAWGSGERAPLRTLAVHRSPPLSELLQVVNKESHNLYAEQILFALGRIAEGDASFEGGGRAVGDYLTQVVGVPAEGLRMEDGSGLSRLNRAPASAFVQVLGHMEGHEWGDAFRASLPEAGNNRELRRMFRSAAAGNLRAKTGTIHRVSALSGTVQTAEGEVIAFSIIANDVPSPWAAKQLEDRIGIQLASFSRPFERQDPRTAEAGTAPVQEGPGVSGSR